jgi:hypothetical protein
VHGDELAVPFEAVVSVSVVPPPANVQVATVFGEPDSAGAVKVTESPLTGVPLFVVAVVTRDAANAAPTVALCPDPLVAASTGGRGVTAVLLQPVKTANSKPVSSAAIIRAGFVKWLRLMDSLLKN